MTLKLFITNCSISLSPKSNRSNLFKCTKESGIDPIKFSLSSNDVKFVNLREEEKNHYYLRNIGKGKKSFWIDKKIYNNISEYE